jgi:hypothetical protein
MSAVPPLRSSFSKLPEGTEGKGREGKRKKEGGRKISISSPTFLSKQGRKGKKKEDVA